MDSVSVMKATEEKTAVSKAALPTASTGARASRASAGVTLVSVERTAVR